MVSMGAADAVILSKTAEGGAGICCAVVSSYVAGAPSLAASFTDASEGSVGAAAWVSGCEVAAYSSSLIESLAAASEELGARILDCLFDISTLTHLGRTPQPFVRRFAHCSYPISPSSFSTTVPFLIMTRVGTWSIGQKALRNSASLEPWSMRRRMVLKWRTVGILGVGSKPEAVRWPPVNHSLSHSAEVSSPSISQLLLYCTGVRHNHRGS